MPRARVPPPLRKQERSFGDKLTPPPRAAEGVAVAALEKNAEKSAGFAEKPTNSTEKPEKYVETPSQFSAFGPGFALRQRRKAENIWQNAEKLSGFAEKPRGFIEKPGSNAENCATGDVDCSAVWTDCDENAENCGNVSTSRLGSLEAPLR
jgi:hypothetical protein